MSQENTKLTVSARIFKDSKIEIREIEYTIDDTLKVIIVV